MGTRKIVTLGDDTLRKHCKPQEKFDRRLATLLKDMAETMYKAEGVGLAAPQVGILRRVAVVDVTDDAQVRDYMQAVYDRFGRVDILINFAGLSITRKLEDFTAEDYDKVMNVNVKGMVFSTKAFAALADPAAGALVINIGSMAAKRANANAPHYSAAKAAVNMFTDGLAQQLKGKNIRFTVINPGPTDTTFFEGRIPPEKRGDFMRAGDIAEVLEFIMTRDARINFHELSFDSFAFFQR